MKSFSFSRKKFYLAIAFINALVLSIISGWREVGIDRNNYLEMYHGVISSDEWAIKFWYAKDIFFLAVASISNFFSEDAKLSFLVICIYSVLLKYVAIRKLASGYTLCFVFLYSLFLSPGLEFAAIRGGLAIGFVMLALAYRDQAIKLIVLSALAIASHLSVLLIVLLTMPKINALLSKHKWVYIAIFIIISASSQLFLELFPHGVDYEGNRGTAFAFFEPLATLFIAWLIFFRLDKKVKSHETDLLYINIAYIRQLVYGIIAIAFGFTSAVVTASTRYLEVSWCLLLFTAIVMFKKSYINMIGCILFFAFLSYVNIVRSTWLEIFNTTVRLY